MKKILRIFVFIFLVVFIVGCAKQIESPIYNGGDSNNPPISDEPNKPNPDGEKTNLSNLSPQEGRKVIYNASLGIITTDPSEAYKNITDKLAEYDAYVESHEISNQKYKVTFRVKTENLTTFINLIQAQGETISYILNSEDITNTYITYQAKLTALQTQHERLLELYNEATDTKTRAEIAEQLLDIEAEMEAIELKINEYDSFVEYSTIYLTLTKVENLNEILPQTEAPTIYEDKVTNKSVTILINNIRDKVIDVKVTLLHDGKVVEEVTKTVYQYDKTEVEFKNLKPGKTYRIEAIAEATGERPSYKTYLTVETEDTYFSTIGRVFVGSINAFIQVLKYLSFALIAVLPFGVVGTGIGFGISAIYKKNKQKKQAKKVQQ